MRISIYASWISGGSFRLASIFTVALLTAFSCLVCAVGCRIMFRFGNGYIAVVLKKQSEVTGYVAEISPRCAPRDGPPP